MFEAMMERVRECFAQLPDSRQPSNNTKYRISDAALSALSVFFMQSPSFLAHQRDMERKRGRSNVQSLFGAYEIPCDNQIRQLLDPIPPEAVGSLFWQIYQLVEEAGALKTHRGINDTLLCAIDGTQYFSSPVLSCANCSPRPQGDQVRYTHSVLAPVLVAPHSERVLSLEPEFIWPQDGSEKQDCEQNALKRWLKRHQHRFAPYTVTILADDLHSKQPTCELCLAHNFNFLFVCLPDSHPTLYQEIELLERIQAVPCRVVRQWNGRHYVRVTYRYLNHLPLRAGDDALLVNWCASMNRLGNCSIATPSSPTMPSAIKMWPWLSVLHAPVGKPRTRTTIPSKITAIISPITSVMASSIFLCFCSPSISWLF
jgi:hypothetical protein